MTETIARILVPLDFSADSERTLGYATTLATRFDAALELLHVVEDPIVAGSPELYVLNVSDVLDDLTADARRRLEEMEMVPVSKGLEVATNVVVGRPPASMIVERAKSGGFDLIVMGTHGRSGLSHALMGSVAERVVRTASCPVMTVRDTRAADQPKASAAVRAAV